MASMSLTLPRFSQSLVFCTARGGCRCWPGAQIPLVSLGMCGLLLHPADSTSWVLSVCVGGFLAPSLLHCCSFSHFQSRKWQEGGQWGLTDRSGWPLLMCCFRRLAQLASRMSRPWPGLARQFSDNLLFLLFTSKNTSSS